MGSRYNAGFMEQPKKNSMANIPTLTSPTSGGGSVHMDQPQQPQYILQDLC
jgi:hypothetical protein